MRRCWPAWPSATSRQRWHSCVATSDGPSAWPCRCSVTPKRLRTSPRRRCFGSGGTLRSSMLAAGRRQPGYSPSPGTRAVDALRLRRSTPVDPSNLALLRQVSTDSSPDEAVDSWAAADLGLVRALRELPVEQRRALVLAAVYGLTSEAVSRHESIPVGTAKTRIRTALVKLRRALDQPAVEP